MRIATWNLERPANPWGARARRLLAAIQAIDADIWVLTETHEKLSPGPEYVSVGTEGSDRTGDPGERWTMIWSRVPVLEKLTTTDPIRTVAARVQAGVAGSLVVYGTVLPWRSDVRWRPLRGAAAFVEEARRQVQDWAALRRDHPHAGFCVAGDFNQERQAPFYAGSAAGREAIAEGLRAVDCVWTTGLEDPLVTHTNRQQQSVDHVCLSRESHQRVTGVGAWPDAASFAAARMTDHFGVWLDLN